MPKQLLLTKLMREALVKAAETRVQTSVETAALEAAYEVAEPMVRRTVELRYPPKDMKVCAKYQAAVVDNCIKLQFPNGVVDTFWFLDGTGPLVVSPTYRGTIYLADAETASAVEVWLTAKSAVKTERNRRISAYCALIDGSRTLENVVEVWPEAAEVIPRSNALIALGPEQIEVIRRDREERARKEEQKSKESGV